jgi:exodeoxyribonuclease VII large subunit
MPETAPLSNPPLTNAPEYSVSEIAGAVKRIVEDRFGFVRVRGEISGWKVATSGHVYFRLKDDGAVLDAVCWRGTAGKLAFKPEDGLEVVATGKVTTYPGKSSYQIVVDRMEPAGAGALMALLEKRRQMFAAEGLFAAERKKPLPFLPRTIGVVTSPTGAVIRDILHRLGERFPVHVIVWPVPVQGEGAAEQIAAAIDGFCRHHACPDLIIVARGGGSIEDLWAFNEEIVVRAAANAHIPLISAVGHETDTTLIDFVSDRRAPTPTAAAEMAVPVRAELLIAASQLGTRLQSGLLRLLQQRGDALTGLARGLPAPSRLLEHATQRLDDWAERLRATLPQWLARKEQQLGTLSAGLRPQLLAQDIARMQQRLEELAARQHHAVHRLLDQRAQKLQPYGPLLESFNYQNVLKRGYALVRAPNGDVIKNAASAHNAHALQLEFHDGTFTVKPA